MTTILTKSKIVWSNMTRKAWFGAFFRKRMGTNLVLFRFLVNLLIYFYLWIFCSCHRFLLSGSFGNRCGPVGWCTMSHILRVNGRNWPNVLGRIISQRNKHNRALSSQHATFIFGRGWKNRSIAKNWWAARVRYQAVVEGAVFSKFWPKIEIQKK